MKTKIQELKTRFAHAQSDGEREAIDREMDALLHSDKSGFENAMLSAIKETNQRVEEQLLRQKLEGVLPAISVSYLAKNYFNKSPQWFYQRLNGNSVNGKPAKFTPNELMKLRDSLTDISTKINQSVASVV
ncbi:hypothetical protein AGMMS49525_11670 [Bacteroidia bacterium]|nr:hypothetical protein AGMMS49525_11640 [Bacteroidia bacterium]GHT04886.1 hypothetical protein AGMMS49525_11670 [Bacteroidia bacterium]